MKAPAWEGEMDIFYDLLLARGGPDTKQPGAGPRVPPPAYASPLMGEFRVTP